MLHVLLHVVVPALALDAGGALVGPINARPLKPSAAENARLRAVRRAARDGMCTNDFEDAAIAKVGGEHASVYGEITSRGFATLAEAVGLHADDTFVDCGSGLGRTVVQAARDYGVRSSTGVEYAASRHKLAEAHLARENDEHGPLAGVRLLLGDCADAGLWRGELGASSVVYASNLLFDDGLNERLRTCLEECASIRCVAALKVWPDGLAGFGEPVEVRCETSWSAPLVIFDADKGCVAPHAGSPVFVYERSG